MKLITGSISRLHSDVGEELFASVFQTGTKEIDHIINDEEAVMIVLAGIYYNR